MCYQVTCSKCGKPTWAGCGKHIEEVLKDVSLQNLLCKCILQTCFGEGTGGG